MPSENATLELALRDEPQAVMLTNQQLIVIANTDFVPTGLRGNVPACLACVARGRAMGIPDMVALNGIAIINGKATLSAELMEAIAREHGHSITFTVSEEEAVVRGKRADNGDTGEARFSMKMAERAGLLGKDVWKKHPDDMMFARAMSKLCRRLFADCYAGGTYTKEEMESPVDEVSADEVLDDPPPQRVLLDVPETEIKLGQAEPGEQTHLEDAPNDDAASQSPPPASMWQQLARLARDSGVYDQLLATAKERFPGRTPGSLNEDECAELWKAIEPVNA